MLPAICVKGGNIRIIVCQKFGIYKTYVFMFRIVIRVRIRVKMEISRAKCIHVLNNFNPLMCHGFVICTTCTVYTNLY